MIKKDNITRLARSNHWLIVGSYIMVSNHLHNSKAQIYNGRSLDLQSRVTRASVKDVQNEKKNTMTFQSFHMFARCFIQAYADGTTLC